jgi:hypothetical protein
MTNHRSNQPLQAAHNNLDFAIAVGDPALIASARFAFRAARSAYLRNAAI